MLGAPGKLEISALLSPHHFRLLPSGYFEARSCFTADSGKVSWFLSSAPVPGCSDSSFIQVLRVYSTVSKMRASDTIPALRFSQLIVLVFQRYLLLAQ